MSALRKLNVTITAYQRNKRNFWTDNKSVKKSRGQEEKNESQNTQDVVINEWSQ